MEENLKIDMTFGPPPMMAEDSLNRLLTKNRDVLELMGPAMDAYSQEAAGRGSAYGIAAREGAILDILGNIEDLTPLGYERGRIHTEMYMGTNAIGTCIKLGKPVALWGEEHQREELWGWAGFGAPIFGPEDELRAVFFVLMPIEKACREIIALASIVSDSVERQLRLLHDKERLVDIYRMMEKGRDSIVEASSIISHEVRNSLTNISAYIQLLQLDKSINNFRGTSILREIARINRLLDDFKLLSGNHKRGVYPYSLKDVIGSIVDNMRSKAEINNVEIIFRDLEKDLMVNADGNALDHVFINLLDNAIQAMEDGGKLYIDLDIDEDTQEALVIFKDTGPGIMPDQIDKIFEIFHTTKQTGSGLGLHICRTIIEFHGGSIEAVSNPGEGATFFVRLPIAGRLPIADD